MKLYPAPQNDDETATGTTGQAPPPLTVTTTAAAHTPENTITTTDVTAGVEVPGVRGQDPAPEKDRHREKRKRARSPSSSSDSSDSHSRKKRDKKKERKREKKRGKKEKKEKKKGGGSHWGKYGIISDVDIFSKTAEFHAWLVEERKTNPETISKDLQRKEFARFVEDYNTATLPHEKYYNMEAYERRMNALRSGEYLPPTDDVYDFEADLKAIKSAHKRKVEEPETHLSREQLMELRKVQQERAEISKMKLLGMDIKQSHGVRMDGSAFDE
ncbi:hypothetical protein MD484_g6730, partial [Candolleomyces efflorescens]